MAEFIEVTYHVYLLDGNRRDVTRLFTTNEDILGETKAVAARMVQNGFYFLNPNDKNVWISPNKIAEVVWD